MKSEGDGGVNSEGTVGEISRGRWGKSRGDGGVNPEGTVVENKHQLIQKKNSLILTN